MAKDKGKPSKEEPRAKVKESFQRNKSEDDHDERQGNQNLRDAINNPDEWTDKR